MKVGIGDSLGAAHDRLDEIHFHQRHMLVRGGLEDHVGAVAIEYLGEAPGTAGKR